METSHETEETLLEWLEGGPTRGPRSTSLRQFYPDSAIFSQLRTIYTTQVDPMMKMLHLPSLFATLTPAVESPGSAGRSIEAAIFCFCLATMSTMAENQFSQVYGQTKDSLIYKQRRLARQSLTNARFMENPDLLTFQALCLYLVGTAFPTVDLMLMKIAWHQRRSVLQHVPYSMWYCTEINDKGRIEQRRYISWPTTIRDRTPP